MSDWRTIAADMIDAEGFTIDGDTDAATLAAASFVFDEGILFLTASERAEIAEALRAAAANDAGASIPFGSISGEPI